MLDAVLSTCMIYIMYEILSFIFNAQRLNQSSVDGGTASISFFYFSLYYYYFFFLPGELCVDYPFFVSLPRRILDNFLQIRSDTVTSTNNPVLLFLFFLRVFVRTGVYIWFGTRPWRLIVGYVRHPTHQ